MKRAACFAALVAVTCLSSASAGELKSGLQPGKRIGPFYVTKVAGATEDGVEKGDNLCYRCKYGGRPMVMVFTRDTGKQVQGLVKQLDKLVAKHTEEELKAFVNVLAEDKKEAEKTAKQLVTKTKAEQVPSVVPNEFENGPDDYGINPKADVTIILANGGTVVANHAFTKGQLNKKSLKAVLSDLAELIKG
jgi:hypothetical protein